MLLLRSDFRDMVSVAQLVELWIVAPAAAGSNPVAHPIYTGSILLLFNRHVFHVLMSFFRRASFDFARRFPFVIILLGEIN